MESLGIEFHCLAVSYHDAGLKSATLTLLLLFGSLPPEKGCLSGGAEYGFLHSGVYIAVLLFGETAISQYQWGSCGYLLKASCASTS